MFRAEVVGDKGADVDLMANLCTLKRHTFTFHLHIFIVLVKHASMMFSEYNGASSFFFSMELMTLFSTLLFLLFLRHGQPDSVGGPVSAGRPRWSLRPGKSERLRDVHFTVHGSVQQMTS